MLLFQQNIRKPEGLVHFWQKLNLKLFNIILDDNLNFDIV